MAVAFHDPLEVLERNFSIVGQEERLLGARDSTIKIQNASFFVVEDHVAVEAVPREHHNGSNQDNCDEDSRCSVALKTFKVVKELVHIAVFKVSVQCVEEHRYNGIQKAVDAIPAKHMVPKRWEAVANQLAGPGQKVHPNEHKSVRKCASTHNKHHLPEFPSCADKLRPRYVELELGDWGTDSRADRHLAHVVHEEAEVKQEHNHHDGSLPF